MNATATAIGRRVWTEEEMQALPDDGFNHEVVDGELAISPKNDSYHGDICADLLMELRRFAKEHKLGAVWDSSTGLWMFNCNCRAPDVSFIRKERLLVLNFTRRTRRFFPGGADLAVEVLSPNNTRAETNERLADFFSSGTQIAWIIDPQEEAVEVCYSLEDRKLLRAGAFLDGEHLLPGFRYAVADLFKEWDWD